MTSAYPKDSIISESLRAKCEDIATPEESEVVVKILDSFLRENGAKFIALSAPQIDLAKNAAIIRSPDLVLDLINPVIMASSGAIISFRETCLSFGQRQVNCMRKEEIVVQNGLDKKLLKFNGAAAAIIQHEIDHLNGKVYTDRMIRAALVRQGGVILDAGTCPCGSRKTFARCCKCP